MCGGKIKKNRKEKLNEDTGQLFFLVLWSALNQRVPWASGPSPKQTMTCTPEDKFLPAQIYFLLLLQSLLKVKGCIFLISLARKISLSAVSWIIGESADFFSK